MYIKDSEYTWTIIISVQLLALLGSVLRVHVCVVSGLLRVFISRRLGAYMCGSRIFFPGGGVEG